MVTSSKRAYAIPKSAAPRAHVPAADHQRPTPPQETFKHSSLSLYGVRGSRCTHGLFEPSERLWWEWGWILNVNLPFLPSCWGFFFALGRGVISSQMIQRIPSCRGFSDRGCGVSPNRWSSKVQPLLMTLDLGYLLSAAPVPCSRNQIDYIF